MIIYYNLQLNWYSEPRYDMMIKNVHHKQILHSCTDELVLDLGVK